MQETRGFFPSPKLPMTSILFLRHDSPNLRRRCLYFFPSSAGKPVYLGRTKICALQTMSPPPPSVVVVLLSQVFVWVDIGSLSVITSNQPVIHFLPLILAILAMNLPFRWGLPALAPLGTVVFLCGAKAPPPSRCRAFEASILMRRREPPQFRGFPPPLRNFLGAGGGIEATRPLESES